MRHLSAIVGLFVLSLAVNACAQPVTLASPPRPVPVPQNYLPINGAASVEYHSAFQNSIVTPAIPIQEDVPTTDPIVIEPVTSACDCDSCQLGLGSNFCERRDPFETFVPTKASIWINTEWLIWWRKGIDLPTLVSNIDAPPAVLLGFEDVGNDWQSGGRTDLGLWFSEQQTDGIGLRFYGTGQQSSHFNSSTQNQPVIVRPFSQGGVPMVLVVHNPAANVFGHVLSSTTSEVLGTDLYYRRMIRGNASSRIDLLTGYQTSRIDESVIIRHQFVAAGVNFDGTDRFITKNEFHGIGIGVLANYYGRASSIELLARLGLGDMRQTVYVSGTDLTGVSNAGSLLARNSNGGVRHRHDFTAVREISAKWKRRISENAQLGAGYTLIYWKNVAQAGNQIDTNLPNPAPLIRHNSYFVHGLSFLLDLEY